MGCRVRGGGLWGGGLVCGEGVGGVRVGGLGGIGWRVGGGLVSCVCASGL